MAWRQNTGVLPDRSGRPIRFGLCVGSSDIIAIAPDGVFVALECKSAIGQPTDAQVRFLAAVQLNVVPPTVEFKSTLEVVPLQIVCGDAEPVGVGLTVIVKV